MNRLQTLIAVLEKDLRIELRSKYGLNTVLAFVAASMTIILFTLGAHELPVQAQSGLVWIIVLFATLSTISRTFVAETEHRTLDVLRLNGEPVPVYLGKLIFNFCFALTVTLVTLLAYLLLLDLSPANPGLLALIVLLGCLGLAAVTTLLGAVIAQATRKGTIFSVLCMPLLLPLVLLLAQTTEPALTGTQAPGLLDDMLAMAGFGGVTVSASIVLFDFIWED